MEAQEDITQFIQTEETSSITFANDLQMKISCYQEVPIEEVKQFLHWRHQEETQRKSFRIQTVKVFSFSF